MSSGFEVIWRRGDADMPENVSHVIKAAQDELLLRSLQLPIEAVDFIRYDASKSDKTINEYLILSTQKHKGWYLFRGYPGNSLFDAIFKAEGGSHCQYNTLKS